MTTPSLSDALPASSAYLFVYVFALLPASLLLSVGGTFLTLDRSRAFPARYTSLSNGATDKKSMISGLYLQGGIGGLVTGFTFGVHLSTFLSLLIPAKSGSPALSSVPFLVVWILPSILLALSTVRWRLLALLFSGISGGALLALAFCIIIHPSLTTRTVLMIVYTITSTLATTLPFPACRRPALRISTSASGAFGIVLSIALLAKIPSWSDPWEHLWVKDGDNWGTSKEKGFSALFCVLFILGIVSDWALHSKFGECPDEKWDDYLADYTANSPNRQGTFTPFVSFWDRLFNSHKLQPTVKPGKHNSSLVSPFEEPSKGTPDTPTRLQSRKIGQPRRGAAPSPPIYSTPFDKDDDRKHILAWSKGRLHKPQTFGTKAHKKDQDAGSDYSDVEDDLGSLAPTAVSYEQRPWKLASKTRPFSTSSAYGSDSVTAVGSRPSSPSTSLSHGLAPVPATPSLLKSLSRAAKQDQTTQDEGKSGTHAMAFAASGNDPSFGGGSRSKNPRGRPWDVFWKDVQDKAAQNHSAP